MPTATEYLGAHKPLADALGTLQRGTESAEAVPMNEKPGDRVALDRQPAAQVRSRGALSTHPPMEGRILRLHELDAASGIHD